MELILVGTPFWAVTAARSRLSARPTSFTQATISVR